MKAKRSKQLYKLKFSVVSRKMALNFSSYASGLYTHRVRLAMQSARDTTSSLSCMRDCSILAIRTYQLSRQRSCSWRNVIQMKDSVVWTITSRRWSIERTQEILNQWSSSFRSVSSARRSCSMCLSLSLRRSTRGIGTMWIVASFLSNITCMSYRSRTSNQGCLASKSTLSVKRVSSRTSISLRTQSSLMVRTVVNLSLRSWPAQTMWRARTPYLAAYLRP